MIIIISIIITVINIIIRWTRFIKPEPAFNMFSLGHTPLILGIASLDPGHQVMTVIMMMIMIVIIINRLMMRTVRRRTEAVTRGCCMVTTDWFSSIYNQTHGQTGDTWVGTQKP